MQSLNGKRGALLIPHLKGDVSCLIQVLTNVLKNAVQNTIKGTIDIIVSYDALQSMLHVAVIDSGSGMSP